MIVKALLRYVVWTGTVLLALGHIDPVAAGDGLSGAATKDMIGAARGVTRILAAFAAEPLLRSCDLTVVVDGDRAVLGGVVGSDAARVAAGRSAATVAGIGRVDNRIRVDARAMAPERTRTARSAETIGADAAISTSVRSRLLWNTHTEDLDVQIDTREGNVTLRGNAISYAERDVAGIVAASTNGVSGVSNDLVLTDQARPIARPGSDRAASQAAPADAWITSRVQSSLALTRGVSATAIAVSTRRGVVSLSGSVPTQADRDVVVQVAQDTRGVKDVVAVGLTAG